MPLSLEEKLRQLRQLVESRLRAVATANQPESFYGPVRYTLEGGGKRLRPVLVLLTAEAVGGALDAALPCAVAVELMHNFTLVHDDIMDKDELRRGRPTVHVVWDQDTAILAGDGLLALAYQQLFLAPADKLQEIGSTFSDGVIEVCEGQALDKEFETQLEVSLDQYMEMIEKKTARLFSTACKVGALAGGGERAYVNALAAYGRWLGLAFQVQDDLLDVLSDEKTSGKPRASDIRRRKKTFLFVHALRNANASDRQWLLDLYASDSVPADEVDRVVELFRRSGAIAAAEELVTDLMDKARAELQHVPANEAAGYLSELTSALTGRRA